MLSQEEVVQSFEIQFPICGPLDIFLQCKFIKRLTSSIEKEERLCFMVLPETSHSLHCYCVHRK